MDEENRPPVQFLLLGAFEVRRNGVWIPFGGRAEQSLLALMLLNPGQVLPAARLIDLLWEEGTAPADPQNALQNRVSKTRRLLATLGEGAPTVRTVSGGYRLDVDRSAVDVHRFIDLVDSARRRIGVSASEAERDLGEALGLWRGSALSGFQAEPWASREVHRLDELRVSAAEQRLALAIDAGRPRAVIDEARRLADEHPLHEGMTHLLMRALYLSGRQADALAAYRRLKDALDEQLGLEPSAHLRELEVAILRQDPDLGDPAAAPTTRDSPTSAASDDAGLAERPAPRRSQLVHRLTSFLGREDDVARLLALVDQTQLVSICGTGGAGKTSLAIEVARQAAGRFADGVTLVELAGVSEEHEVDLALADALGLETKATDGSPARDQVVAYLAHRAVLIVLDNCEHVVQRCAELAQELASTSRTHLLATTREPLNVPGEVVYRLQPLTVPPADEEPASLHEYTAVQLFLDRSIAAVPFAEPLDDDELRSVAAICRAVDGIPLAIELAAAMTPTLGVSELADRLTDERRLTLLTLGPRTADARQRTLRAAIDWSHELLASDERVLFRRLAVFREGWTLPAAERVTSDDDVAEADVLNLLGRLVQRSLVVAVGGSPMRFRLLETIRSYAWEQLRAAGELDALQDRHAEWVLELARESETRLRGSSQARSLEQMHAEHANIRAAVRYLSGAPDRSEAAAELGGALAWYFHLGRHAEGRETIRVLEVSDPPDDARARLMLAKSIVYRPRASLVHPSPVCESAAREALTLFESSGDEVRAATARALLAVQGAADLPYDVALDELDQAGAVFASHEDDWGTAFVAFVRLALEVRHGSLETSREWGERAAREFEAVGDRASLASVRFHLGLGLRRYGSHLPAVEQFEEAAAVAAELGLRALAQWAITAAGVSWLGLDELERAETAFSRAASTPGERGDPAGDANAAHGAGLAARARNDPGSAARYFQVAQDAYRALGTPIPLAAALNGMVWAALRLHDLPAADQALTELVQCVDTAGDALSRAWKHEARAQWAIAVGDPDAAARELADAAEVRSSHGLPAMPFEQRESDAVRRAIDTWRPTAEGEE